jgi:hypothetical protein
MAKPEGGLFYRTPSVKTDGNEKSFGEIAETLRVLPRPLGRGKNAVKEIIFHALKGVAIFPSLAFFTRANYLVKIKTQELLLYKEGDFL